MLTHLSINNFAIVDSLDLELTAGMSAITGETGAGKSIMLDALGLTLGDRADSQYVQRGSDRADISTSFDIEYCDNAVTWLKENELYSGSEVILRRTITKEGRSRGFINGQPVPLQQLKSLGEMLIDIHNQHEHQSLLKRETHRLLLDEFAGITEFAIKTKNTFDEWQRIEKRIHKLQSNTEENTARFQLLSYQIQELLALELQPNEVETLEKEQKRLSQADSILYNCNQMIEVCSDTESTSVLSGLSSAISLCKNLTINSPKLETIEQLLCSAQIQVEEALIETEHYVSSFEINPQRLTDVEERLSIMYTIARKHKVVPERLLELQNTLQNELDALNISETQLEELEEQSQTLKIKFF